MENFLIAAVWALLPTVMLGIFGFFLLRSILRADRNERKMYDEVEREEREKLSQRRS